MPFAPLPGLTMYYELHGPEEAETLLLFNGAFGVLAPNSDWGKVLPRLAGEYRIIAFEHRGHGRTNNPSQSFTGYDQLADDAISLLKHLKIPKAHMVGFSDGAITLLDLSTRYSQFVDGLVLIGANYYNDALCQEGMEKLTVNFIEQSYPEWAAELEKQHGSQGPGYWKKLAGQLYAMWMEGKPNYTPAELAQINPPTLVMAGQYDPFANRQQTLDIHDAIKGSELCIVPGAAHAVLSQRPEISGLIILDFLKRHRKKRDRNKPK